MTFIEHGIKIDVAIVFLLALTFNWIFVCLPFFHFALIVLFQIEMNRVTFRVEKTKFDLKIDDFDQSIRN